MAVVLISGCSSGFGLLTAVKLAATGHTVYATLRNLDKKEKLVAAAAEQGISLRILPMDVTQDSTITAVVQTVQTEVGRLDVLINNAGFGLGGSFEDLTEGQIRDQFETNFFGVLKVTRQCLPLMRATGSGKIINISSIAGFCGVPGMLAYSASKFALEGFSEALRYELERSNIVVTVVEPGSYQTQAQKNRKLGEYFFSESSPFSNTNQKYLDATDERIARTGQDPNEVADLLARIIGLPKPAMRYVVGKDAKAVAFLRAILPFSAFSKVLLKNLYGE